MKKVVSLLSVLVLLLCLSACGNKKTESEEFDLWKNAMYVSDAELGEGDTTLTIQVKAEDHQVTFTIHTDKATVGEAMMEHGLLEGEEQAAGLYLKKVNGITADWDVDQTYWAFYIGDAYAMTGVESTDIEEGVTYRLERSK